MFSCLLSEQRANQEVAHFVGLLRAEPGANDVVATESTAAVFEALGAELAAYIETREAAFKTRRNMQEALQSECTE